MWFDKTTYVNRESSDEDVGVQPKEREMGSACRTVVMRGDVQVVSYRWKEVLAFETKMKRRGVKASSMGASCTVCTFARYRDGQ